MLDKLIVPLVFNKPLRVKSYPILLVNLIVKHSEYDVRYTRLNRQIKQEPNRLSVLDKSVRFDLCDEMGYKTPYIETHDKLISQLHNLRWTLDSFRILVPKDKMFVRLFSAK